MKFDSEQTKAIETIGSRVLVSASAGAGKTGVLVARLTKRCVQDRVPITRILAVTFTEAAAAEMKKRLAISLHAAYETAETEADKQYLNAQLVALSNANITTIDSFCLSIIKKYANVISLDPATAENILPEGRKNTLLHEAYEKTIEHWLDQEMLGRLFDTYSHRPEDLDALFEGITSINNTAQASPDPEKWYQDAKSSYQHIAHFQDFPEPERTAFYQSRYVKLEILKSQLNKMQKIGEPYIAQEIEALVQSGMSLEKAKQKQAKKYESRQIEAARNAVENCRIAVTEQNYSSYITSLTALAELKTPALSSYAPYKKERGTYTDTIKSLLSEAWEEESWVHDNNDLVELNTALIDLAEQVWNEFVLKKQELGVMDFTDMERYALQILEKDHGTVAEIYRNSLDEIMIDEFQDTSLLQNAIIDAIAKENNTFRVGDVKQSIYRFRQAKPDLMRSLMADPITTQIHLRHNYRSDETIVAFTNNLFGKLMNIPGTKDVYQEDDTVQIGGDWQKPKNPVPIEFALLDAGEDTDTKKEKATWIAKKILLLKQEDPTLSFHRFAVLVKSHAEKLMLRQVFDAYGIPYDTDAREGFFASDLCRVLLSLLRWLMDEDDAMSLLAVCTSSYFSYSDEELGQCKTAGDDFLNGIKGMHPEIFQERQELLDLYHEYDIYTLLDEICKRHGFYDHLSEAQKANFDCLYQVIINNQILTVTGLISFMEEGGEERSSEAVSTGKDDDIVTITTIHQSKGLQYDIVFLWCTGNNKYHDISMPVLISDELKLGWNHIDMPNRIKRPTLQRIAIGYQNNLEDLEEYTRLLYVAVTRAKNRLYCIDTYDKEKVLSDTVDRSVLFARKGMTNLLLTAMQGDDSGLFITTDAKDILDCKVEPYSATRNTSTELPHFTGKVKYFESLSTPSETEVTALPPLDWNKGQGRQYGTLIHECLADLPNRKWNRSDLTKYNLRTAEEDRILAFGNSDLYARTLKMKIHKEYPYFIDNEKLHARGTMDFVAIDESTVVLIDYKTDRASLKEIAGRYRDQLLAYRCALEILYPGRTIEVYAWSLHNNDFIPIQ